MRSPAQLRAIFAALRGKSNFRKTLAGARTMRQSGGWSFGRPPGVRKGPKVLSASGNWGGSHFGLTKGNISQLGLKRAGWSSPSFARTKKTAGSIQKVKRARLARQNARWKASLPKS